MCAAFRDTRIAVAIAALLLLAAELLSEPARQYGAPADAPLMRADDRPR